MLSPNLNWQKKTKRHVLYCIYSSCTVFTLCMLISKYLSKLVHILLSRHFLNLTILAHDCLCSVWMVDGTRLLSVELMIFWFNFPGRLFLKSCVVLISVHLIGKDGDRVFDERDVIFTVGEGKCDCFVRDNLWLESVHYKLSVRHGHCPTHSWNWNCPMHRKKTTIQRLCPAAVKLRSWSVWPEFI